MKKSGLLLLTALLSSMALSSCASWNSPSSTKKGVCNTLKSNIVFSGSTGNTRQAEIQEAEQSLDEKSYDQNNC